MLSCILKRFLKTTLRDNGITSLLFTSDTIS